MIDACNIYEVEIRGFSAKVKVCNYSSFKEAEISKAPEDCYPEEIEEIEWYACTGNDLLDEYINCDTYVEKNNIVEQLSEFINEKFIEDKFDKAEAAYSYKKEINNYE